MEVSPTDVSPTEVSPPEVTPEVAATTAVPHMGHPPGGDPAGSVPIPKGGSRGTPWGCPRGGGDSPRVSPGVPRAAQLLVPLRHRLGAAVQPRAPAQAQLGGDRPVRGQGDKGTRGQRDKGTKGQGDKGTRDGDTLSPCPRRDAQRSYEELSAICSEQDNYSASRQLLFQVCPQPCPLSPNPCPLPPNLCPLSPALSLYLIPFFCPDLSSFAPISAPCRCPRACPR